MNKLGRASKFLNQSQYLFKNNWALTSKLLTLGFLIYLLCILTGNIDKNNKRLQTTELGLVAFLLLINSNIVERIQELQLNKDGWNFKLGSKVEANIKINQKEAKALTYLGTILLAGEDKKEDQKKHFFDILLDDGERDLLEELYKAEDKNEKLPYEKTAINKPLQHLAVLGFVDNLSVLTKCPIDFMPERGDLREYFRLSDTGRRCLAFGSSKVLQPSATNSFCEPLCCKN